jgi:hypothetical protein
MKTDNFFLGSHTADFNAWMYSSICGQPAGSYFTNRSDCKTFAYGIVSQGYYNSLMEFVFLGSSILKRIKLQHASTILNSDDWLSMRVLVREIFSAMNVQYMNLLFVLISNTVQSTQFIMLGVMLGYVLTLIFAFLIFWVPYIIQLRLEIWRTNGMLLLIPSEVYMTSKLLRAALEKKVPMLTHYA